MKSCKEYVESKLHPELVKALVNDVLYTSPAYNATEEEEVYEGIKSLLDRHAQKGEFVCCLCAKIFAKGYFGNNANPVFDGRCCDACNAKFVIPARILEMVAHSH